MIFAHARSRAWTRRIACCIHGERAESDLTRDLYSVSLDTLTPEEPLRISREDGVHAITMAPAASFYLDTFTSASQPPQVGIHAPRRPAARVPAGKPPR